MGREGSGGGGGWGGEPGGAPGASGPATAPASAPFRVLHLFASVLLFLQGGNEGSPSPRLALLCLDACLAALDLISQAGWNRCKSMV